MKEFVLSAPPFRHYHCQGGDGLRKGTDEAGVGTLVTLTSWTSASPIKKGAASIQHHLCSCLQTQAPNCPIFRWFKKAKIKKWSIWGNCSVYPNAGYIFVKAPQSRGKPIWGLGFGHWTTDLQQDFSPAVAATMFLKYEPCAYNAHLSPLGTSFLKGRDGGLIHPSLPEPSQCLYMVSAS